jgi:hypothetical protein
MVCSVTILVSTTRLNAQGQDAAIVSAAANEAGENSENQDAGKGKQEQVVSYVHESGNSVTGFYGGAVLGFESIKNQYKKISKSRSKKSDGAKKSDGNKKEDGPDKVKKSKAGVVTSIFAGYNFEFGKAVVGLECSISFKPAKTETEMELDSVKKNILAKRRFGFGVYPRVGYKILDGLIAYIKLGTDITKYHIRSRDNNKDKAQEVKKSSHKAVIQTAIGLEQHFGQWFIRGECGKFFNKNAGNVEGAKISSGSWGGVIGAGYKF